MKALAGALEEPVRPVEVAGWDGDALEAQAFGLLAARVARGLPITFPGTTGAPAPLTSRASSPYTAARSAARTSCSRERLIPGAGGVHMTSAREPKKAGSVAAVPRMGMPA